MTCIIHGVSTKKELKAAIASGDFFHIWIEDPSIFKPMAWSLAEMKQGLPHAQSSCVVTNHPKRRWFAQLKLVGGRILVE